MGGWIKLYDKMLNWEWYGDTNVVRVFLHCLLKASYCPKNWCGIQLERGQFVTCLSELTKELNLSQQQTRTAISKLISTREITSKSTNKYTIITVSNYDNYQASEDDEQQAKQQAEQQTNNKQTTSKSTNKERTRKEEPRKEEEYIADNIDIQNIKESISKDIPKKAQVFSMKIQLISDGLSEELVDAYMRVRKAKKAPDSEIAYKGLKREADKAGVTMETAITECVERNWVGFKAEWYARVKPQPTLFSLQQPDRKKAEAEMEEINKRTRAEREERERKEAEAARARDKQKILDSIYKQ